MCRHNELLLWVDLASIVTTDILHPVHGDLIIATVKVTVCVCVCVHVHAHAYVSIISAVDHRLIHQGKDHKALW